jgi:hypothetical protein
LSLRSFAKALPQTLTALLGHMVAFWAAAHSVMASPGAWLVLYLLGVLAVVLLGQLAIGRQPWQRWLRIFGYAALGAALFFGADFALDALGKSVAPRSAGAAFHGGVELYHVLFPGLASVAFGFMVSSLVCRYRAGG